MSNHDPLLAGDDLAEIHDTRGGASPRRHHSRSDDGRAFLPDPYGDGGVTSMESAGDGPSDFAEELGESFVTAATGNVDIAEQTLDRVTEGELGGPYVVVDGAEELALGTDPANPVDAERAPFPAPMRGDRD